MVVLDGYCDESGPREDGTFVVAGAVFSEEQGKGFLSEWVPLFERWGGCRWVELVHRQGRFKGITPKEKDQLVKSAVAILARWPEYCVAVVCNVKDVEYMTNWFPDFMSPYGVCCSRAVSAVAVWLSNQGRRDRVTWTFEAGHKDHAETDRHFSMVANSGRLRAEYRYAAHAFVPKDGCAILQAGDCLAWEAGKFHAETIARQGKPNQRKSRASFARYWIEATMRGAVGAQTLHVNELFHHWRYIKQNEEFARLERFRKARGMPPLAWPYDV